MAKVTFDYSKAESFISNDEVNSMKANSKTIRRMKVNVRSEESKSKHSYV